MTENRSTPPAKNMKPFRDTLNKVMVNHDTYNWAQLLERLQGVDYDIGQSRLSQYINGKRTPEDLQGFFAALGNALDLSESEKLRIVYAFAYPDAPSSDSKMSQESWDKAAEFRNEIIEQKQSEENEGISSDGSSSNGV